MAKAKHYIPNRAGAVTPYLVVSDGQAALAWYQNVFGATIDSSMEGENGAVMHAELRFGPDQIYLAQEFPGPPSDAGYVSPETLGGSTVTIHLYVTDVDAVHAKAMAEGAREIQAPTDQFWGTATAPSWIPSAIAGASRPTSRTSPKRNSKRARWPQQRSSKRSNRLRALHVPRLFGPRYWPVGRN